MFEVIEKSVETLDLQLGQKKIVATHAYREADRPYFLQLYGDQHRYLQILLNFLSNAIKFTPENGTITIKTILKDKQTAAAKSLAKPDRRVAALGAAYSCQTQNFDKTPPAPARKTIHQPSSVSDNGFVKCYLDFEIRIIDSGCGISKENLGKLFMNFAKLEEHSNMNHRGTGLGLSICKSLIELMGGSVSVESELGQGTSFIMSLKTKCRIPAEKSPRR